MSALDMPYFYLFRTLGASSDNFWKMPDEIYLILSLSKDAGCPCNVAKPWCALRQAQDVVDLIGHLPKVVATRSEGPGEVEIWHVQS
jgi:hypothetical protein